MVKSQLGSKGCYFNFGTPETRELRHRGYYDMWFDLSHPRTFGPLGPGGRPVF